MTIRETSLKLTERLASRSEPLAEIFEYIATPRQIQIMCELPRLDKPAMKTAEVGSRLGLDVKTVREELEDMARKGLVRLDLSVWDGWWLDDLGQMQARNIAVAPKIYPDPKKVTRIWAEFMLGRYNPAAVASNIAKSGKRRVIPAWRSVKDNLNLQWWEDWREIFKRKKVLSARPCVCRLWMDDKACERPVWNCIKFDDNHWAEQDAAFGYGRWISLDEAIQIQDEAARAGLVGEAPNMKNPVQMCNCCRDCCALFRPIRLGDVEASLVFEKSRYRATIDIDKCSGCQKCIDNCQFEAISMVNVPGSKKLKAQVDLEKCFGCGCCFMVCDKSAISMECVRPDYEVPETMELLSNWR